MEEKMKFTLIVFCKALKFKHMSKYPPLLGNYIRDKGNYTLTKENFEKIIAGENGTEEKKIVDIETFRMDFKQYIKSRINTIENVYSNIFGEKILNDKVSARDHSDLLYELFEYAFNFDRETQKKMFQQQKEAVFQEYVNKLTSIPDDSPAKKKLHTLLTSQPSPKTNVEKIIEKNVNMATHIDEIKQVDILIHKGNKWLEGSETKFLLNSLCERQCKIRVLFHDSPEIYHYTISLAHPEIKPDTLKYKQLLIKEQNEVKDSMKKWLELQKKNSKLKIKYTRKFLMSNYTYYHLNDSRKDYMKVNDYLYPKNFNRGVNYQESFAYHKIEKNSNNFPIYENQFEGLWESAEELKIEDLK